MKSITARTLYAILLLLGVLCLVFPRGINAATGINRTINFQGKLVQGSGASAPNTNVADTSYTVIFSFYDRSSGGSALWSETQTVTTTDGLFRVALGTVTPIPANFNFNWDGLYLGIKVGSDSEMTPRITMSAVPFAFNAEKVSGLTVQDTSGNASTSGILQIANGKTVQFGDAFTTSAFALTLTTTGTTNVTLPTTGTLTTLAGSEILTNKSIGSTGLTFSGAAVDITSGTNEDLTLTPNGSGNLILTSDFNSGVSIGSSANTLAPLSISGGIGANAGLIVNQTLSGDLFVASQAGTTRFVLTNGGSLQLTASAGIDALTSGTLSLGNGTNTTGLTIGKSGGTITLPGFASNNNSVLTTGAAGALTAITTTTSGQCLVSNSSGNTPSWTTCPGGVGNSYWDLISGALRPTQASVADLLLGGTSTASAKFAFINNLSGTPTASISGNSGNIAMYFDGLGNIATTNRQALTLGNATTTGNISLLGGNVGIGTTTPVYPLDVTGGVNGDYVAHIRNTTGGITSRSVLGFGSDLAAIGASISYSNSTYIGAEGSLSFMLNTTSNTPVYFATNGTIRQSIDGNGNVGIGTTTPASTFYVAGKKNGARAAVIIDQLATGAGSDLFTASAAGAPKFSIANDGQVNLFGATSGSFGLKAAASTTSYTLTLPGAVAGGSNYALVSDNAGTASWLDTSTFGSNYWNQLTSGSVLLPKFASVADLLLGGTSTASAKFAFINNLTGTPTASISANSGNIATTIDGLGNIGTTNRQDLVLGTATTGNLYLKPGGSTALTALSNGNIGIGTTVPLALLDLAKTFANTSAGTQYGNRLTVSATGNVSSGTDTTYGQYIDFARSGATGGSINGYGQYITATGSGTMSYLSGSTVLVSGSGNTLSGMNTQVATNADGVDSSSLQGLSSSVTHLGTGQVSSLMGLSTITDNANSGNISSSYGIQSSVYNSNIGTITSAYGASFIISNIDNGNINNGYGVYISSATNEASGVFANNYGVYINDQSAVGSTSSYNLYSNGATAKNYFAGLVGIGTTAPTGRLQVDGQAKGKALTIFNNTGDQNILVASQAGATKFTIANDGQVNLFGATTGSLGLKAAASTTSYTFTFPGAVAGGSNYALVSNNSGTGSWLDTSTFGSNYWDQLTSGSVLLPKFASVADLLLGGTSTASAKFAFINNLTGTPTASISANSGVNAFFITGTGALSSVNRQNITIGNSATNNTTGNLLLNSNGVGNIGIGTTAPGYKLNLEGTTNQKALAVINGDGNQDLLSASVSGVMKFIINSAGNLGLGTANPSRRLEITSADSSTALLRITNQQGDVLDVAGTGAMTFGGNQSSSTSMYLFGAGASGSYATSFTGDYVGINAGTNNLGRLLNVSQAGSSKFLIKADGNVGIGTTTPLGLFNISGATTAGQAQPLVTFNQTGAGDIFSASVSGAPIFTLTNAGGIKLGSSVGTGAQCLVGGATAAWGSCGGGTTTWDLLSGALRPSQATVTDLLLGGTSTASAKFAFINNLTGTPTASIGGNLAIGVPTTPGSNTINLLNNSTLNISNSVGGDGGANTALFIDSKGNIGIGTTAPSSFFKLSIAGGMVFTANGGASSQYSMLRNASNQLEVTGGSGGMLFKATTNVGHSIFLDTGNIGLGTITPTTQLHVTRSLTRGATGQALALFDQYENQDLFTASASGTPIFSITSAGGIKLGSSIGSNSQCMLGGSTAGWGTCGSWDLISGALRPTQATVVDLLLGGTSTSSAKFAFINNLTGTPTASISANSGNNALYITGDGTLATTNRGSLVLGNTTTYNTTGNILLHPNGTGNVGIGTTAPTQKLEVAGSIKISNSGGLVFSDGTTQTTASTTGSGSTSTTDLNFAADSDANGSGAMFFATNGSNRMAISNGGNVGIGNTTPLAALDVTGSASISADIIMDGSYDSTHGLKILNGNTFNLQRSPGGDVGLVSAFFMDKSGNIGIGTTAPTDRLTVSGGNIKIDTQTNSTTGPTKITQTQPGTIASGGNTLIASVSASVVYNGSLYVGTGGGGLAGGAEVYRYDGGTSWTRVTQSTAGQVANGGTSNIASISAMTVFNGKLYIGTWKTAQAEVYAYGGSTTWNLVSTTTPGTIRQGGTAAIDGVTAMTVFGGKLWIGTTKSPSGAEVYRYEGGATWTIINSTAAGRLLTVTGIAGISSMVAYNNTLYVGTKRAATAEIYKYTGAAAGTPFVLASGAGTICGTANVTEIASMVVYGNRLYAGTFNAASGAQICRYDDPMAAANAVSLIWSSVGNAAGTIRASGTSSIAGVRAMTVYNNRLYIGTEKNSAAELYRYIDGDKFELISNGTAGTMVSGGTASIDHIYTLIAYNGSLYFGTGKDAPTTTTAAEVYSYNSTADMSYGLEFHAASSYTAEQAGFENTGIINFIASGSALTNNPGKTGSFLFSHGIITNTGAYDVAEDYPTRDDQLEPGDVVALDIHEGEMVKRSDSAYQKTIMGVYSENPALHLSQQGDQINGSRAVAVALAGRVPVKVSTENGPIMIGDLLTSSSVPGVAMRATKSGAVIGHAMQEYNAEGVGKITVYVNPSTSTGAGLATLMPGISNIDLGESEFSSSVLLKFMKDPSVQMAQPVAEMTTDRLAAGLEIITPRVTADVLAINTIKPATGSNVSLLLSPEGKFVIADNIGQPAITFDAQGNGIFTGTITAKKIKAQQIEGLEFIQTGIKNQESRIMDLETLFASGGAVLSASDTTGLSTAPRIDTLSLLQVRLASLESRVATLAAVSQPITAGSVVAGLTGSSDALLISLLTQDASSAASIAKDTVSLKSLDIAGLAKVSGDMRVKGNSLVEGVLSVIDSITTQRLFVTDLATFFGDVVFKKEVQFVGRATFNKDTAGNAIIKKGAQKVTITFEKAYGDDPLVTATMDIATVKDVNGNEEEADVTAQRILSQGYTFVVSNKSAKGFTIVLNKQATEDIRFSWNALLVNSPTTTQGTEKLILKGGE